MDCFHRSCTKAFLPTTLPRYICSSHHSHPILLITSIHVNCHRHCLMPSYNLVSWWFCRLAGDAWIFDSSSGCGSKLLCRHLEGQLGWYLDMPYHWLLPIARAHSGIRWIQKFLYTNPWNIQHYGHYRSVSVPHMGADRLLHLGTESVGVMIYYICSTTLSKHFILSIYM